jgi:Fe-Mn family superoxide dismutase
MKMIHILPELPYAFNALEPYIDGQTMQLHHDKHHQTAVDNLNKAITGTDAQDKMIEELLANVSVYPSVRSSAGSHYNHSLFWQVLTPVSTEPGGELAVAINHTFGSLEALQEKMSAVGMARLGSGWVWLIVKGGSLEITSTPNQDNPLMDIAEVKGIPILGIDVWEHAYYLKYYNHRAGYLSNIWNIINWNEVEKRYEAAI